MTYGRHAAWLLGLLGCAADAGGVDEAEGTTGAVASAEDTTGDATPADADSGTAVGSSGTDATPDDESSDDGDPAGESDGTGDPDEPEAWIYPEPDWLVEPPEAHGFDPDALAVTSDVAAAEQSGCLVVTRHGVIVHEWYADGWDADRTTEVWSVTKSVTSTLVGIAQAQELLHVDDFASDYIEPWATTESASVTVGELLQQDSGRHWDFFDDYVELDALSGDKSAFAIGLPQQHEPGTWWEYNNAGVQSLEPVIRTAVDQDVAEFATEHLFEPIGMQATMAHDDAGNTITYAYLQAGCRALARYGYLYLRRGQWADGEQIIPAEYVDLSTTPRTELNDAYGYLWWLNQPGHWVRPSTPGRNEGDGLLLPNAPIGAYTARGLGAQVVAVDPSTEVVFTRLSAVPPQDLLQETNVEHDLWSAIMTAIVE